MSLIKSLKEFSYISNKIDDRIPIILGPTASGKTEFAINLCRNINGEIISVDSRQIYKDFKIGTNQPSRKELEAVTHYLIDSIDSTHIINAYEYIELIKKSMKEIKSKNKKPVLVGGSLLYINLLINGIIPEQNKEKINGQNHDYKTNSELWSILNDLDSTRAQDIHPNDRKKIERAIDIINDSGKTVTQLYNEQGVSRDNENFYIIELANDRDFLDSKIKTRLHQMLEDGWIDEVRGLIANGTSIDSHPMQSIGYRQIVEYLDDKWDKEALAEEIYKRTRLFAKRQLTWIRKIKKDILIKC